MVLAGDDHAAPSDRRGDGRASRRAGRDEGTSRAGPPPFRAVGGGAVRAAPPRGAVRRRGTLDREAARGDHVRGLPSARPTPRDLPRRPTEECAREAAHAPAPSCRACVSRRRRAVDGRPGHLTTGRASSASSPLDVGELLADLAVPEAEYVDPAHVARGTIGLGPVEAPPQEAPVVADERLLLGERRPGGGAEQLLPHPSYRGSALVPPAVRGG